MKANQAWRDTQRQRAQLAESVTLPAAGFLALLDDMERFVLALDLLQSQLEEGDARAAGARALLDADGM